MGGCIMNTPRTAAEIDAMTIDEVFAANDHDIKHSNFAKRMEIEGPKPRHHERLRLGNCQLKRVIIDFDHNMVRCKRAYAGAHERRKS